MHEACVSWCSFRVLCADFRFSAIFAIFRQKAKKSENSRKCRENADIARQRRFLVGKWMIFRWVWRLFRVFLIFAAFFGLVRFFVSWAILGDFGDSLRFCASPSISAGNMLRWTKSQQIFAILCDFAHRYGRVWAGWTRARGGGVHGRMLRGHGRVLANLAFEETSSVVPRSVRLAALVMSLTLYIDPSIADAWSFHCWPLPCINFEVL